jgi:hypothetical protein
MNTQYSYIEIFSNATIRRLRELLPQIANTPHIANLIQHAPKDKCDALHTEQAKVASYEQESGKTREWLRSKNKPIKDSLPKDALEKLICVPEHAFVISQFRQINLLLGTVELAACIGLVVVNPIKKRAAITHLNQPTIETYKGSLRRMFTNIITDKNDQCQIYLIGGSPEAKEKLGTAGYRYGLSSETLACSIMEFLGNYKGNYQIERVDMFHKDRPASFAILLHPAKDAKLFKLSDSDVYEFEKRNVVRLAHENMIMDDSTRYRELQEYSTNPVFLDRPKDW